MAFENSMWDDSENSFLFDLGSMGEKIKSVRATHGGLEYVIQTDVRKYSVTAADFKYIGESVLCPNVVLSEELKEILTFADEKLSCIQKALNHLSYSAHPEKKLRMKLYGKFSAEAIDTAVEILKENGYIDDLRLAFDFCDECFNHFQMGPQKIKAKLMQKQFSSETVREVFESFEFDDEQMRENMEILVSRKFGNGKRSFTREERGKVLEYLIRNGYSYDDGKDFLFRFEE